MGYISYTTRVRLKQIIYPIKRLIDKFLPFERNKKEANTKPRAIFLMSSPSYQLYDWGDLRVLLLNRISDTFLNFSPNANRGPEKKQRRGVSVVVHAVEEHYHFIGLLLTRLKRIPCSDLLGNTYPEECLVPVISTLRSSKSNNLYGFHNSPFEDEHK